MRVRILELAHAKGLSRYALARAVEAHGVSAQAVYRLCRANGAVRRLDTHLLDALCEVFNVTPAELLERAKQPRRPQR